MILLLLACTVSITDGDKPTPTCDTQTAYQAHADALRELADMQELCATLDDPYTIVACFTAAPAMPTVGIDMIRCELRRDAAEVLTQWLVNVRPQFEAHCHADKDCRDEQQRRVNKTITGVLP